jgi:glycosyltransferase involved in cell wall biosynthesis
VNILNATGLAEPPREAVGAGRALVSLVICTYNQEALIPEALASALAQTYSPLEVIVSDDCSTDATYRIVQQLAAAYQGPHRLVLNLNPVNLGIARHWDAISRMANGRLIVHAAGDDISVPTRVEELANAWARCEPRPYLLSSNGIVMSFEGVDKHPLIGLPDSGELMVQAGPNGMDFDDFDIYVPGFALAVDKRLYETLPPLTTWMWSEDDILRSRALLLGPIAFLPRALVRYRDGGLSKGAVPGQASYIDRFSAQARARLNYLNQLTEDFNTVRGPSVIFTALMDRKKASARRRLVLVETRSFTRSLWTLAVQLILRARTDGVTGGQYVNMFLVRWFPRMFFRTRQVFHRVKAAQV